MKELDLEKLKQKELDILKVFIGICKKYELKYFMLGGTCLGAVRHKGFIPWDDDIDVGMPRKDYERFAEIAERELPQYMFFQNHDTDKEYPMCFGKIRNSDTTYIEKSVKNLKINHGIYIDVFPLDGMPTRNYSKKLLKFITNIYYIRIARVFFVENIKKKRLIKKIAHYVIYLLNYNLNQTIINRDKMYTKYDYYTSDIIANHGGAWGEKEIMPREVFGNGTPGEFEGITVRLPEKYDEYLTRLYGDYMTPPPPEKRVGHHYYTIADMEKSYKNYI